MAKKSRKQRKEEKAQDQNINQHNDVKTASNDEIKSTNTKTKQNNEGKQNSTEIEVNIENTNTANSVKKNLPSFIVGIIVIFLLLFISYNYFLNTGPKNVSSDLNQLINQQEINNQDKNQFDELVLANKIEQSDVNNNSKSIIYSLKQKILSFFDNDKNNEVAVVNTDDEHNNSDQRTQDDENNTEMIDQTNQNSTYTTSDEQNITWTANDYKQGDIQAGTNYTVKQGDTLWEIAEAAYGNGTQWENIAQANSQSIDYLANGQQALIYSGQVLVIPQI